MRLLLDALYLLAFTLASPWILYRSVRTGHWRTIPRRFGAGLGEPLADCVLLHASSVGEVAVLRPLVARLEAEAPGQPLAISTYTEAGLTAARAAFPRHRVIVFPFDLSFVVDRFLRHLSPHLIVIVESELWPIACCCTPRRSGRSRCSGRWSRGWRPRRRASRSRSRRIPRPA